jgi:hypothetical protein
MYKGTVNCKRPKDVLRNYITVYKLSEYFIFSETYFYHKGEITLQFIMAVLRDTSSEAGSMQHAKRFCF